MAIGSRSSGTKNSARPESWLIPSIGDLVFIALLALLTFSNLSVRLLGDAGIGWHIRTGQLILTSHAVPHVDPFSSSMPGQPWYAWEWLYDLVVGWLDAVAGLNGVVFLAATVIALTFSFTFRMLLARGTDFLLALMLVLLAASASMIHFFARPHIVTWLFTVLWFWILESTKRNRHSSSIEGRRQRVLWLLPLLMILWVNIHGGFLLGILLLAIYWLDAAWKSIRLKEEKFEDALQKIGAARRARELATVGIVTALATLLNPYGGHLHTHIYHYLTNRFLIDHIDEFQSPNFHEVAQRCFALLILLVLVGLATRRWEGKQFELSEVLLILFAIYSGLYSARNIPVSSLLLVLIIGPWLSDATGKCGRAFSRGLRIFRPHAQSQNPSEVTTAGFFQRMQRIESSLRGHLWPVAALLFTAWIAFHGGKFGQKVFMQAHFDSHRFPAGAVDFLASHNEPGPVFAPDYWGGYLIYRLYPEVKLALDDRHDFYGEEFLRIYLKTIHIEPGWQEFLQKYPVHSIIVPKNSALANILLETPPWQPIYSDDLAVVFTQVQSSTQ